MAYDASNNQSEQEENQVDSTPLGNVSDAPSQSTTPPASQPSQSPMASAPAPAAQAKPKVKSPRASSGMFSNVQKYVQANKPQAGRMSSDIQQGMQNKAQQVRSKVDTKQDLFNQNIGQREDVLDENYNFAQGQVGDIMAPERTEFNLEDTNVDRYQELMRGDVNNLSQMGVFDLGEERGRVDDLRKMAGRTTDSEGRKSLLRDVYGGSNYTRGESNLDEFLLSGEAQGLKSGADQTYGGIRDLLGDTLSETEQRRSLFNDRLGGVGDNVTGYVTDAMTDQQKAIDEAFAAATGRITEGEREFKNRLEAGEATKEDIMKYFGEDKLSGLAQAETDRYNNFLDMLDQIGSKGYGSSISNILQQTGEFNRYNALDSAAAFKEKYQDLLSGLMGTGLTQGANLVQLTGRGPSSHSRFAKTNTAGMTIQEALRAYAPREIDSDYIANQLLQQDPSALANAYQLTDVSNLSPEQVVDNNLLLRMNALKTLSGNQDLYSTPEEKVDISKSIGDLSQIEGLNLSGTDFIKQALYDIASQGLGSQIVDLEDNKDYVANAFTGRERSAW